MPAGAVTLMGPVTAFTGTCAPRVRLLVTAKASAGVPLNETAEVPMKLVPEMVIQVPAALAVGENPLTTGGR